MSKIVKKADLDVLIESTLKTAGIEVPKKKKIVTEVHKKKKINEGRFSRFDNDGPWYDNDDMPYDELPEGDYDDIEYGDYDEFLTANPNHKHFMGSREDQTDASRNMFNQYKEKYGPLRGKTLRTNGLGESKSVKKPLINEDIKRELDRFNKLTNFKY